MRALIIDDDEAVRELLAAAVDAAGLQVTTCASAEQGWATYISGEYALIVLDWVLPQLDGLELCRRMRASPQGARTVILIVTARRGADELKTVLESGADDYIAKPIDPEVLKVRIAIAVRAARNLVARDRAESRLRDSEMRLGAVASALPVTLFALDANATCTLARGTALQECLQLDSDPVGADFRALLRSFPRAAHALQSSLAGNTSECVIEGVGRVVELRFAPVLTEDNHRIVNGLATDVTERVRMQQTLQETLERMERADAEISDLRRQLDDRATFHDLVGRSPEMLAVYDQIRDYASVDWTVLVGGETGTGKELVARAIHNESPRRTRPFVAVNCAGLSVSLLQSQLFGHRKGAFTGATADQAGYFEAADGGTLFLDEIGDVSPEVQMSLLRVLEEGEITRIGESHPRKVSVRVIAATNRDLQHDVETGRFRADLLYRIRVARITLPPLRDRRMDIPLLIDRFLERARAATGKEVSGFSDAANNALLEYSWPGNVRELRSAIEFSVARARGEVIERRDLSPELQKIGGNPTGSTLALDTDEETRIRSALAQADGNRTRAARLLGISRATFYRRIAELDLDV